MRRLGCKTKKGCRSWPRGRQRSGKALKVSHGRDLSVPAGEKNEPMERELGMRVDGWLQSKGT